MIKVGVLLLAAGESKRMGRAKQLLPWGNGTLIKHQIDILQKTNLQIFVVLGANSKKIKKEIADLDVHVVEHKQWSKGMGTSIACGVNEMNNFKTKFDAILITLVDQPFLSTKHYQQMIAVFKAGKQQIVVSQSKEGLLSAPALFDSWYIEELMKLDNDYGAKIVFKKFYQNITPLLCQTSIEDIDTLEQYQFLLKKS